MQTIIVDMTPGYRMPTIYYSQGDIGRTFAIDLRSRFGDSLPASPTITIQATKPSGLGFSVASTSISGAVVTFTVTETMSNEAGRFPAELKIVKSGTTLFTANFYIECAASAHPEGTTDGDLDSISPKFMSVTTTTLPAGDSATYSYDPETNTATFGIPKGADGSLASGVLAADYSTSKTYAVGDYVYYSGNLYRCTTAITTAEAWTSGHWTQVALGDDVSDLKSAIALNKLSLNFEQGTINATNGNNIDTYPTVRIRTADYIDISHGISFRVINTYTIVATICLYDSSKTFLGAFWTDKYINTLSTPNQFSEADLLAVQPTAKYMRLGFRLYPEAVINASDGYKYIEMFTGRNAFKYQESMHKEDDNITDIASLLRSEKGYINITNVGAIRTTINSNGSVAVSFAQKLTRCFKNSDTRNPIAWEDISSKISSNITISGNSAVITVPTYRELVLNTEDYNLYLRQPTEVIVSDFVILSNASYSPQGWAINMENYQLRLTSNDVLNRQGTGKYTTRATDIVTDCTAFSSLMLDVAEYESFLFFTDPHWLGTLWDRGTDGEIIVYDLFALLERYRNATNVTFTLCGGDWLDNSDTEAEASFKMGFVKGSMKNLVPYYMLVGNHDTNYQGTDTLSAQSISNLWYDGKKSYFDFNGLNTHFYCFDTGVENENVDYEQAEWFANALLSDSSDHIALAMHILYYTLNPSPTIQPLAQTVLDIAQAYNGRTSITVNGHSYNYASASGKVEFVIAGHTHADANYTVNGIPCIVTRNTWIPGSSTYAFDLVCVNYDDRQIDLIRVGNGSDRAVSF